MDGRRGVDGELGGQRYCGGERVPLLGKNESVRGGSEGEEGCWSGDGVEGSPEFMCG